MDLHNEAIYMGIEYARENLSSSNNLHIYTDSQVARKAIIGQSRENYHKNTICQMLDETKLVYCPANKGIPDNETADSLAKVALRKAKHLSQRPEISLAEISKANKIVKHYLK